MKPYVLSAAVMRLWGYPMKPLPNGTTLSEAESTERRAVKRKLVEDGNQSTETPALSVGLKRGCLPTLEEASVCLAALQPLSFRPIIEDIRKGRNSSFEAASANSQANDFLETLDSTSESFLSLWPDRPGHALALSPVPRQSPLAVAAIDCEMCDSAAGPQLTRLSVLDGDNCVVLDTLVKPKVTQMQLAETGPSV